MTYFLKRHLGVVEDPPPLATQSTASQACGSGLLRKQVDYLAAHMVDQLKDFESSEKQTQALFEQILQHMEEAIVSFKQSFLSREIPIGNVYAHIDSDRSVGIMHVMWHTVSFVTRGNTRPMALERSNRDPIFSGRIVALHGDYLENVIHRQSQEHEDILEDELASLFVPASADSPIVMRFRHNQEELFFHPSDAAQQFLMKTLEAVCSGGTIHESV